MPVTAALIDDAGTPAAAPSVPAPRRGRRVGLAVAALALGALGGRFALMGTGTTPAPAPVAAVDPVAAIERLRAEVDARPADAAARTALGVALTRDTIRTADPSRYAAAREHLDEALRLDPDHQPALVASGVLELTLHRFAEAEELGRRAAALDPFDADALAVRFDAAIELGRYDAAGTHLQDLLDLRPSLPAYARLSYWHELHGRLDRATAALAQAESAGSGSPFDLATVVGLQGDLALRTGDLQTAAERYDRALALSPDVVGAVIGLARTDAARGDIDAGIARLTELTERLPRADALALLGDLQLLAGDADGARATFDVVRSVITLERASGATADLELALFEADHGGADALALAAAAHAERPTTGAADVLAWARYRAGDARGAADLLDDAERLGPTGPVARIHAAAIRAAVGQDDRAREDLAAALAAGPALALHLVDDVEDLAARLDVARPATWELS